MKKYNDISQAGKTEEIKYCIDQSMDTTDQVLGMKISSDPA